VPAVFKAVVELYCLHSLISLVRLHEKTSSFAFADVLSALVVFIVTELCCNEYFVLVYTKTVDSVEGAR